uniref:Uncharacterized protein n=1 Tax=Trypanosoma congolense (strain IL3000) TaxID=1068625 RepID=G0UVN8_TRYCI|nr:conserved hypothetical protein [Trypanosoma congolense IL3000]
MFARVSVLLITLSFSPHSAASPPRMHEMNGSSSVDHLFSPVEGGSISPKIYKELGAARSEELTNEMCKEMYGDNVQFDSAHNRCVWIHSQSVADALRFVPLSSIDKNECLYSWLLSDVLSSSDFVGMGLVLGSVEGEEETSLRCGHADLRRWFVDESDTPNEIKGKQLMPEMRGKETHTKDNGSGGGETTWPLLLLISLCVLTLVLQVSLIYVVVLIRSALRARKHSEDVDGLPPRTDVENLQEVEGELRELQPYGDGEGMYRIDEQVTTNPSLIDCRAPH